MASSDVMIQHNEGIRPNFKRSRSCSLDSVQKKLRFEESVRAIWEERNKKSFDFYRNKSGSKSNSYRGRSRYEKSDTNDSRGKENNVEDSRQEKKTGAKEASLVCRPATARKSASEGDESREATEAFEDTFKEMKKKFVMMKMLKKTSL